MIYILQARDANGTASYYTGNTGPKWTNPHPFASFPYATLEGARRKATVFNRMTAIHGLWFIAIPYDDAMACHTTKACFQCKTERLGVA